jgi:predicted protein tyrosine phosphatase
MRKKVGEQVFSENWEEYTDAHGNKAYRLRAKDKSVISDTTAMRHEFQDISQLTELLYVGTLKAARSICRGHNPHGIDTIVNVCSEYLLEGQDGLAVSEKLDIHDILLYDGVNPPLDKVGRAILAIAKSTSVGKKVLVNCHAGISRSVSICIGYLVATDSVDSAEDALRYIRRRRAYVNPSAQVMHGVKKLLKLYPYDGSLGESPYNPVDPEAPEEQVNRKRMLLF